MAVRIKICGIRDLEDASLCIEEGADALGFIFYPQSPRFILPSQARKIIKKIPCFISKVGVFADEREEKILQVAQFAGLDTLQFHGKESPSYCNKFRKRFKVVKSFFPKEESIISLISKYEVDGVLLDIPFEEKKKIAKSTLDLHLVKKISKQVKFLILSGGLSPLNIGNLVKKLNPYAVDVARGVEKFPGKKDKTLVRKFIKQVKSYG